MQRVGLVGPHHEGIFTGVAVAFGVVTTLFFGIVPEPLLSLANQAASHLFVR